MPIQYFLSHAPALTSCERFVLGGWSLAYLLSFTTLLLAFVAVDFSRQRG